MCTHRVRKWSRRNRSFRSSLATLQIRVQPRMYETISKGKEKKKEENIRE